MLSRILYFFILVSTCLLCKQNSEYADDGKLDYLSFVGDERLYGSWKLSENGEISIQFKKNTLKFYDQTFIYDTQNDTLFLWYGNCTGNIKLLYELDGPDTLRLVDIQPYFSSRRYINDSLGGVLYEYVHTDTSLPKFREPLHILAPDLARGCNKMEKIYGSWLSTQGDSSYLRFVRYGKAMNSTKKVSKDSNLVYFHQLPYKKMLSPNALNFEFYTCDTLFYYDCKGAKKYYVYKLTDSTLIMNHPRFDGIKYKKLNKNVRVAWDYYENFFEYMKPTDSLEPE